MEIKLQNSIIKNIYILLLVLVSSFTSAQDVIPVSKNQPSTLHSKKSSLTFNPASLKKSLLKNVLNRDNFDSNERLSFTADTTKIKSRSLYQIKNANFNSKNNLSIYAKIAEKFSVTSSVLATITGNFSICLPGPLTTQLTGSGLPDPSNPWVSSNTAVATVSNTGLVTSVGPFGGTTITYTDSLGNNAAVNVFVSPYPIVSGTLVKCVGGTSQLTGNGTPAAVNPWVSSNPGVATVSNTGLITGITGGTSNITYTNASGCSTTVTVTINPLLSPTISCGAATLNQTSFTWPAVPGAATYVIFYSINGGPTLFGGSGNVLTYTQTGLLPNDNVLLTVTPSGAVGTCFSSGTQTCQANPCNILTSPAAPTVTITQPTCTVATGTITITSVAGDTFSFDGGAYSATLVYSGLAAGSSHTILEKNPTGCVSNATNVTLNAQPVTPAAPTLTPTQPTCTVATGTVTITGVAGQTYSFDGGAYSATLVYSGLAASSSHNVTTQNAAGCISAATNITLNAQPAIPAAPNVTVTQPTCTVATGTITITGVAGETYSFDGGAYSATLVYGGLAASSSHTITAKNGVGCISAVTNVTLNAQPITPAAPTLSPTQPTCTLATGSVTITGVAGLTYSFDGGAYSATLVYSGLAASSSHTVTAQNASGCISAVANITLNAQPVTPAAPTLTPTQPTCTVATGTVTITGVAGQTYSFDGGAYSATLVYSGLAASSSHTVTTQNAAGCISAATNITLNAQPAIPAAPNVTVTQPTCTVATGTITITGVAGETYSFDGGAYSATLVYGGLAASSSHTITAKNGVGCISAVTNVTLNAQPITPAAPTLSPTQPTCTLATGSVTITGVAGLTYSFDGGAYSATLVYSGLAASSSHTVTAQNASGCISAVANITLNAQPVTPAAPALTPTQPTCTVATGSVTITGVAGQTYSFDGGAYSATLVYSGLAASSSHTVTTQNAVGCISAATNITLNAQPAIPAAPTVTITQPTCTVPTGTITITGVAGETYSFDGGAYSATLVYGALAASSSHTITAKNGVGCISAVTNVTLNAQPVTPAAPTLTPTQPTCTVATGSVTITGVAGLTYSFDGGVYSATLVYSGLAASSSHTVTAQNASGCISAVANITLNAQPATPAAPALTPTQPTCTVATGTITITGVAGLTYSFDGGAYSATLVYSGLAASSSHTVTAQNAVGCISAVSNITLNLQPVTPAAPTLTPTQPTCTLATGSVTITGVAGLTYSFDGGAYSATLVYSGLAASSSHTVTAQNAAGCISAVSNITLNAQPVTPAAPTLTPTQPTCTVATGSVTITGVAGLTYSFDGGVYSATLVYSGLAANSSHTVTAQNASGCISAVANITLNAQPATPAAPALTPTQPTCTVATGTITITGVAGLTYSFDGGAYSATLVYSGLAASSSHTVTAQNAVGCISAVSNITLNVQPVTPAAPTLTPTQPTCTLATGSITITGVAGLTYSFDGGAYSATLVYSGLAASSSHTVTAQNAVGCISAVSNITLNAQPVTPAAPTLTPTQPTCTLATGSVTITGVAGLAYSFDGGAYSATLVYSGLAASSSHTVTAQNASGCISAVANITLNAQPATPAAPALTPTQPTCTVATGTITITGVAGLTYSFDGGAYSATLVYSGLAASSSHTVTAQNAVGCISAVSNITLNAQPVTPAAPTLTPTQPTCTLATGSVTITGVAGETYSFDGGVYSATLVYSGLPASSSHTVTAQNAAGCISAVSNIPLNAQPVTPSAPTLTPTQPTCTVATGSVTITGVAGLTYSFDGGAYSATLVYSGLAASSSHTVTAQNADGCISAVSNINLNAQPLTPGAPTLIPTQPTCTVTTGDITITGVAGETYSFDGGVYSATLVYSGLAASSSHTVTAQNAVGCISAVANITLNAQPLTPSAPTLTPTQPTCTVATGSVTITGVTGETYSFDGGVYSATLVYSGLAASSAHTVTAQNADGCISAVSNINLNAQPLTPSIPTLTPTQPTCTIATGDITITGVAGETYSFDGGAYSATLVYSGLAASSSHTVTAQNADGCISAVANITLNAQPLTPSAPTLTPTQPTCTVATGTVTITGVIGETYSFDGGVYSATLVYSGLSASSSHTVTAQNADGCISAVANITLNAQPLTPSAPTLTPTQPTCTVATGTVTITGVAGETYSFDGSAYSATLVYSGLAASSSHTVTAQNADGCISAVSNINLNAQPLTPSTPTLTPTQPTCTIATGDITITGVAGETYSFDGGAYSATLVYSGLAASSSHTVTAQNAVGCISAVANITLNAQPVTPSAPTLTPTQPTCTVATGTVTITGVAGETYSFDGGVYSATLVYSGLAASSSHTVTAQNADGCISAVANITLNAQPLTPAAPTLTPTQPTCTVATGTVTITGVAGETYSFDGSAYSATLVYSGLAASSSHTVTAQNADGCISAVSNINLNAQPLTPSTPTLTPTQPTCTIATGDITITGVAGETYSFDGGVYSATLVYSGLAASSSHTVTAQNADGCISAVANITLNAQPLTPSAPTLTPTQPTCTVATGTVTITGVIGETYSFDGGVYSATLVYSGLPASSSHTVTAQNAAGCISAVSNITLNAQPLTPSAPTLIPTQPTCTVATGTVTITGVVGETYSFDGGVYSATLVYSGLAASSSHTVTAQNADGCISAVANITLNAQPLTPSAPTLTPTQPTCTVATGTVTITGVIGETYSFDGGVYSATLVYSGLAASSSHTVTAQNADSCISAVANITLNAQPLTPSAPTLTPTQPTCTVATGTVTITGVAGETYSFDGGVYSATLVYSGLAASSSHTVTAQNADGCISAVANITLNAQPLTPAAPTLTPTQPTCTQATGAITIMVVPGETYSFDGGVYSATIVYSGLAAGSTHTVTAQNAVGCISAITSITLNAQPVTPNAPIVTPTHPTCTDPTGTVTIAGVTGETYSFDGGAYSATLVYNGLPASSSHTVTAQNAVGCISSVSNISLNAQPATPNAPTLTPTQPNCTSATGTITVTGVAGETYSLDGGAYSATLVYSGLPASSSHTVTAQNAAGCISAVSNISLNAQPAIPNAPIVTLVQPTCTVATGSVTITSVAGETYSFDGGAYSTTLVHNGLAANSSHTVTAKNSIGCISPVTNFTLNIQPLTPIAPTLTPTQPTCSNATGTITITGVTGETYSFDGGPYTLNLIYGGLPASSSHNVKAQNAAGCISVAATLTLSAQPTIPANPILTPTHPTCTVATGTITITNVAGETYSFDGGPYTNTFVYTGLIAGSTHTVKAKNTFGCTSTLATITLNTQPLTSAPPILTPTQPTCTLATGSIQIGAVLGETFSFDGGPFTNTLLYTGLAAGSSHSVRAKNATGCISTATVLVLDVQPAIPLTPSYTIVGPTCTDPTATLTISSVAGETYSFDGSLYSTTLVYTGLAANSAHTITAQNAAGCISPIGILTISPQPVTPVPNIVDGVICVDQATGIPIRTYTLDTQLNSATHTFIWSFNGTVTGDTGSTLVATQSGQYDVLATNTISGCQSALTTAIVSDSFPGLAIIPQVNGQFSNDASVTVLVTSGNGVYDYQMDNGPIQSSNVFTNVGAGTHILHVKDEFGCTDLTTEVTVLGYPNFFTPNGDTYNDTWNIIGLKDQPNAKIHIYDRYGKYIKQISPIGDGWDGTFNNKMLPSTDYWFTVEYIENGQSKEFKSHFSLVR